MDNPQETKIPLYALRTVLGTNAPIGRKDSLHVRYLRSSETIRYAPLV